MEIQETIDTLAGGHFNAQLVEHLSKVAREVLATGRNGSVTVTLKVSTPDKNVVDPMAIIGVTFKAAMPVKDPVSTGYYFYDDGFHREVRVEQTLPGLERPDNIFNITDTA